MQTIRFIALLIFFTLLFASYCKTDAKKIQYIKMKVKVTAYCPCEKCCGKDSPGITATGRSAYKAGIAVDPKIIPLGSHIDVPFYNRGPNRNGSWILCDDVGGKIKGKHIDIRFQKHKDAVEWGVKYLLIRVYKNQ